MAELILIRQEIDLSLTDSLTPTVIHAKQYDHMTRRICCALYVEAALYEVPQEVILSCTGTRPDGNVFQYGSETDPAVIRSENGLVLLTITEMMTADRGRVPIDIRLLDGAGAVLGSFSLMLYVERASLENKGLSTASYAGTVANIRNGMTTCYINDDGYLVMETVDGLGLSFRMDAEGQLFIYYDPKEVSG